MDAVETRSQNSTAELVREALDEVRTLVHAEMALARDDVRREIAGAKRASIAFGAAAACGVLGVNFLIVAFALATFPHPIPALVLALVLLALAALAAVLGMRARPRGGLEHTRERIETDVQTLREHMA
jgi:hypothetical protein